MLLRSVRRDWGVQHKKRSEDVRVGGGGREEEFFILFRDWVDNPSWRDPLHARFDIMIGHRVGKCCRIIVVGGEKVGVGTEVLHVLMHLAELLIPLRRFAENERVWRILRAWVS